MAWRGWRITSGHQWWGSSATRSYSYLIGHLLYPASERLSMLPDEHSVCGLQLYVVEVHMLLCCLLKWEYGNASVPVYGCQYTEMRLSMRGIEVWRCDYYVSGFHSAMLWYDGSARNVTL